MEQKKAKGPFIAFEGIDGSGKSTQVKRLRHRLQEMGIVFYETMEPTDSPVGSVINQIMTGRLQTDNKVIAALFVADRLDHILNSINGIASKVDDGIAVITDRYYFSSYAYNSIDMPLDWVIQANEPARRLLQPDIHIFIDTPIDTVLERIAKRHFRQELFEKEARLIQVREKYLEAFARFQDEENIVIIDGSQTIEQMEADIWSHLQSLFPIV